MNQALILDLKLVHRHLYLLYIHPHSPLGKAHLRLDLVFRFAYLGAEFLVLFLRVYFDLNTLVCGLGSLFLIFKPASMFLFVIIVLKFI